MYDWLKLRLPKDSKMSPFIAGAVSGMLSNLSVYPMELARTRMAMQGKMSHYTLLDIIKNTFKREGGLSAFYKGGVASMVGVWIYKGVGFSAYEMIKKANKDSL